MTITAYSDESLRAIARQHPRIVALTAAVPAALAKFEAALVTFEAAHIDIYGEPPRAPAVPLYRDGFEIRGSAPRQTRLVHRFASKAEYEVALHAANAARYGAEAYYDDARRAVEAAIRLHIDVQLAKAKAGYTL